MISRLISSGQVLFVGNVYIKTIMVDLISHLLSIIPNKSQAILFVLTYHSLVDQLDTLVNQITH